MPNLYDFAVPQTDGSEKRLTDYKDKVVMVVNVASKCGFTPQYAGLEQLYKDYGDKGLAILGFPCNQFGTQEPGTDMEIASFCDLNYGVTFPIFSKVTVNGRGSLPLYQWLKKKAPGLLGISAIPWNFTKFLIDRSGEKVERFAPTVEPDALRVEIDKLL